MRQSGAGAMQLGTATMTFSGSTTEGVSGSRWRRTREISSFGTRGRSTMAPMRKARDRGWRLVSRLALMTLCELTCQMSAISPLPIYTPI